MEFLTTVWEWVQNNSDIVLNGAGGLVLGPIIAKLFRGGVTSGGLGGIVGGVAAGFGSNLAGTDAQLLEQLQSLLGDADWVNYLRDLLEGAVGGLGGIVALFTKRRD